MSASSEHDETIFADALALPADERARFLDVACGGDAGLRRRVEALLEANDSAQGFMEALPPGLPPDANPPLQPAANLADQQIGSYKILQKIGEGGCGVVYMAEQESPVHRRVALKVIKLGMDTKAVIARFDAERQALGLMDHPNIARVLDAGATETGRPYFVMELVRGIKITDFCDQGKLSTVQRLELFGQVCLAVQHAHLKGIIHRDLKPSNILVTLHDGSPIIKVIDFGIAKATQGRLTDHTLFTAFEQFIGTPAYMSPEQAEMSGLDVDTRSDIYSLGVLLYELLTGRQPFEAQVLRQAGIDEIRRVIREVEPPRPSTRLGTLSNADRSTVAMLRATDVPKLSILLSGDIDWIVMKALEKNRTRRYETASALAADITRHLRNEPVIARPPSTGYLLQKLIRRNRVAFAATAAVIAALVIGLGVATWSLVKEKAARERAVAAEQAQAAQRALAEHERERAVLAEKEQSQARAQAEEARTQEAQQRALAEVGEAKAKVAAAKSRQAYKFIASMLTGVGPSVAAGRDTVLLREIMEKTVKRLDSQLQNQPEVELNLRATLSAVYMDLGDYAKAEAMARDALAKAEKLYGREHEDVAGVLIVLSGTELIQGHGTESEPLAREALAIAQKFPGPQNENLASAYVALGTSLMGQGKLPEAETQYREALALVKQQADWESLPPETVQMLLASVLQKEGRLAEAEPLFKEALAAQNEKLGPDHPTVGYTQLGLSNVLLSQGKLAEAETQFRSALGVLKKSLGKEHPTVAMVCLNLAYILHQSGRLAEAEVQYREVLALQMKVLGSEHPTTRQTELLLAQVLQQQNKSAEAASLQQARAAAPLPEPGGEEVAAAGKKTDQAMTAMGQQNFSEAETNLREALPVLEKALGSSHQSVIGTRFLLIQALLQQKKYPDAEAVAHDLVAICRQAFGNKSIYVANTLGLLATALQVQGRLPETETALREALVIGQTQSSDGKNASVAATLVALATVKAMQTEPDLRDRLISEAAEMMRLLPDNLKRIMHKPAEMLAVALKDQGKLGDAVAVQQVAVALVRHLYGTESDYTALVLNTFAWIQNSAGRLAEGEATAREAVGIRRKLFPADHWQVFAAEFTVAECLFKQKKYPEAEALLLSVFAGLKRRGPENSDPWFLFWRDRMKYTANYLVELYQATDRPEAVAEWKKRVDEYTAADPAKISPPKS